MSSRAATRPRRWPAALLVLLCLALAALIQQEIRAPSPVSAIGGPTSPSPGPATHHEPAAGSIAKTPPDAYSDILARPLFVPSRRHVNSAERTSQPPTPPPLAVTGIAMTGSERVAIVQTGNPPKFVDVVEGQEIDGWKVHSIASDDVVLRNGHAVVTLKLKDRAPVSPPGAVSRAAAARPAPAAQPR